MYVPISFALEDLCLLQKLPKKFAQQLQATEQPSDERPQPSQPQHNQPRYHQKPAILQKQHGQSQSQSPTPQILAREDKSKESDPIRRLEASLENQIRVLLKKAKLFNDYSQMSSTSGYFTKLS